MYKELKEPCKSALANGRCLGCTALESPDFESNNNCIYLDNPITYMKILFNIGEENDKN